MSTAMFAGIALKTKDADLFGWVSFILRQSSISHFWQMYQ